MEAPLTALIKRTALNGITIPNDETEMTLKEALMSVIKVHLLP
jgi:hypothetical protein